MTYEQLFESLAAILETDVEKVKQTPYLTLLREMVEMYEKDAKALMAMIP